MRHWEEVFCRDWNLPARNPRCRRKITAVPNRLARQWCSLFLRADIEGDPPYDAILTMIYAARQRLWVVTPYFVPDEPLCQALSWPLGGVWMCESCCRSIPTTFADIVQAIGRDIQQAGGLICFIPGDDARQGLVDG